MDLGFQAVLGPCRWCDLPFPLAHPPLPTHPPHCPHLPPYLELMAFREAGRRPQLCKHSASVYFGSLRNIC